MAQIQFRFFKFAQILSLTLALVIAIFTVVQTPQSLFAQGIPRSWEANQYQPPVNIGKPRRVEGGGTRGSSSGCSISGKPLTALVPNNRFGVTVSDYPTFFVYMPTLSPENSSLPVEFLLKDSNENELYKTTFRTGGMSGIVALSLPAHAGLSPLKVGQDYQWSFSLLCLEDERSQDITVEGWTRRVELNSSLSTQLAQAPPKKQVELYAQAEIWHDALATLVQLRRERPNDAMIVADWVKLLSSASLETLAPEALVPRQTTAGSQLTSPQDSGNPQSLIPSPQSPSVNSIPSP
jgi:hypothetical protein